LELAKAFDQAEMGGDMAWIRIFRVEAMFRRLDCRNYRITEDGRVRNEGPGIL